MNVKLAAFLPVFVILSMLTVCLSAESESAKEHEENVEVIDEKLDYAKGSVCGYCQYCQFCQLCNEDCPCERSPTQPNCHMCKYCKFCYLCSGICDTICQPGGILDKVSSAIVNALPSYDSSEVEDDIAGVQDWIDQKKDEL